MVGRRWLSTTPNLLTVVTNAAEHRRRRARSRDALARRPRDHSGDTHSTASKEACALAERIGSEKVVLVRFGDEQPEKTLLILMGAFGDRFTSVDADRPIKRVCAGGE